MSWPRERRAARSCAMRGHCSSVRSTRDAQVSYSALSPVATELEEDIVVCEDDGRVPRWRPAPARALLLILAYSNVLFWCLLDAAVLPDPPHTRTATSLWPAIHLVIHRGRPRSARRRLHHTLFSLYYLANAKIKERLARSSSSSSSFIL